MTAPITDYKPPFPYFGGKSAVAQTVWDALGDVPNYVEPFAGSAAVLMLRPHEPQTETINDADGFIANFWRATSRDPEAVAEHADNPVNECDLHARHLWLLGRRDDITARLCGDPDWFDAKVAGWWCWGACCWIAGGWCSGKGPWVSVDGVMVRKDDQRDGVNRKLPHLGDDGRGVNRQRPHLGSGQGVNRQLPHLGNDGRGVNRKRPHLGSDGRGVNRKLPGGGSCEEYSTFIRDYLRGLADRLRRVRVCCGDWSRVCGNTPTIKMGEPTGVFLDPPYSLEAGRDMGCYAVDCGKVAHDVRAWALDRGDDKRFRIVLAGYEGEHPMPDSWRVVKWKAGGGYGSQGNGETRGKANAHRERLWISPHCLTQTKEPELFA